MGHIISGFDLGFKLNIAGLDWSLAVGDFFLSLSFLLCRHKPIGWSKCNPVFLRPAHGCAANESDRTLTPSSKNTLGSSIQRPSEGNLLIPFCFITILFSFLVEYLIHFLNDHFFSITAVQECQLRFFKFETQRQSKPLLLVSQSQ